MESLRTAIRRTVEEAVERGGVVCISDVAKRLAARHRQKEPEEIASVLTREALRSGVSVLIGESATELDPAACRSVGQPGESEHDPRSRRRR